MNTTTRWIVWDGDIYECFGSIFHGVCRFTFRDLPFLITRYEFFANKIILEENPIVYQCLEEWIKSKEHSMPIVRVNDYCGHPILQKYNKDFYCDNKNHLLSMMVSV